MRLILRLPFLHAAGLFLFALQLADAPAIAADIATPKYRICPHTKARFIRGNPCPCGHKHGNHHPVPRIVSAHSDCDSDADRDRARAPGFESFVFTFSSEILLLKDQYSLLPIPMPYLPRGLIADPPDTPS